MEGLTIASFLQGFLNKLHANEGIECQCGSVWLLSSLNWEKKTLIDFIENKAKHTVKGNLEKYLIEQRTILL